MGKKVKLEKLYQVYYHVSQYSVIHCHGNTILHFFNKSLIFRVKCVSPLVTMTHIRDLSP